MNVGRTDRMNKSTKKWHETLYTYIWVFNTGRGLSVMIRLPNNIGILYDLGCKDDFSPTEFIIDNIVPHLSRYKPQDSEGGSTAIAQCILSHPHLDHFQEIDAISIKDDKKPPLHPSLLTCPNDKDDQGDEQKVDFSRIKRKDNAEQIDKYRAIYEKRNLPLQTIQSTEANVPNVEYGVYFLQPKAVGEEHPKDNQKYGNGLSILLYLRHGNQSILIPGDVTPEVMSRILSSDKAVEKRYTYFWNVPEKKDLFEATSEQPNLRDLLMDLGLSILIAPHHGLDSCYCEKLFEMISGNKTKLNVISEKRHLGENDGTVDKNYQSKDKAEGLKVDIEGEKKHCHSVSTRNGHHILIIFKGTDVSPHVYLREDPNDLLKIS